MANFHYTKLTLPHGKAVRGLRETSYRQAYWVENEALKLSFGIN